MTEGFPETPPEDIEQPSRGQRLLDAMARVGVWQLPGASRGLYLVYQHLYEDKPQEQPPDERV